jgi:hypothetical protein
MTAIDPLSLVVKEIEALGRLDSDEIAHVLMREKIHGTPWDGKMCPLAVYLRVKTGAEWVAVATQCTRAVHGINESGRIANPRTVRNFVILLDCGAYPDLEWEQREISPELVALRRRCRLLMKSQSLSLTS